MTTGKRIVAAALGGALWLAASSGLVAGDAWSPQTMRPLMATSFDAGSKHLVSYFVGADNGCRLTVMVIDSASAELETPATEATRLVVTVADGKAAHFDTPVGKSLRFTCVSGAQAMNVEHINRLAAYPIAE